MTDMDFGCFLPNVSPVLLKDIAIKADSLGFDCLWGSDHLMSPFPPAIPDFPGYYEAWTTIAYLGGMTENVKLSHQVLVTSFRHPGVLANMASTLDYLTEGRLILTTGAGWYQKEFDAFNIPWGKHKERIEREREAIQVIKSLWTEDVVSFEGKYYRLTEASSELKPFQKPCPPIWIGGDSRRTMELVAELGDGWLMHGHTPDEINKMISKIRPLLGSRSGKITFATSVFMVMGSSKEAAEQKMLQIIPEDLYRVLMEAPVRLELGNGIFGPPEECIPRLHQYVDAGIGHLVCIFIDPGDIERFAEEVLPEFKSSST
jgi:alkanesulfonate monooxygenase SsuD/methylene tetrahydromethanopterin reductase-like flavin-dependent oxidoreductase (luciferase family)